MFTKYTIASAAVLIASTLLVPAVASPVIPFEPRHEPGHVIDDLAPDFSEPSAPVRRFLFDDFGTSKPDAIAKRKQRRRLPATPVEDGDFLPVESPSPRFPGDAKRSEPESDDFINVEVLQRRGFDHSELDPGFVNVEVLETRQLFDELFGGPEADRRPAKRQEDLPEPTFTDELPVSQPEETSVLRSRAPRRAKAPAPVVNSDSNENENSCNTGTTQCCQSIHQSSSTEAQNIFSSLTSIFGVALGGLVDGSDGYVGTQCSPMVPILGGASSCNSEPMCCTGNEYGGLVALGCTPLSLVDTLERRR